MKKKLMCFLLCASMMISALASCGKKDEEDVADTQESERVSMTLSLWIPTNEGTTEEAVEQAEAAINKLTQAKYDTAIELHAIPRDEYQAAIDARIAEVEQNVAEDKAEEESRRKAALEAAKNDENKKNEPETEAPETVFEEETYVNELGATLIKYPDVTDTQLDIFLVQGYDNYIRYIENSQIQQLDAEINASSKLLKTCIYEKYLELLKSGGIYGVPNNHPVGEYSYVLINKELADTYDYDGASLKSFLQSEEFIRDMAYQKAQGAEALQDVTIVLGEIDYNVDFWSVDGKWSLIGTQGINTAAENEDPAPQNVLSIPEYTSSLAFMKEVEESGWLGDGVVDNGEKFAFGMMTGDSSLPAQYADEYYVNVYSTPILKEEDVYGSLFAVSSYSKSLSRSMEIITYLNTDAEIRTILQYGAEGIHWEYNAENPEVINILSDDYSMNLIDTGNVYMTYPAEGVPMSDWESTKQQNLDSIVNPYFLFEGYVNDANKAKMEELAKLSATYKARLDAVSAADFKAELSAIKDELRQNELLTELLDESISDTPAALFAGFYG